MKFVSHEATSRAEARDGDAARGRPRAFSRSRCMLPDRRWGGPAKSVKLEPDRIGRTRIAACHAGDPRDGPGRTEVRPPWHGPKNAWEALGRPTEQAPSALIGEARGGHVPRSDRPGGPVSR